MYYSDSLYHIGNKNSGRYPRGSGDRPYQHGGGFGIFKKKSKGSKSQNSDDKPAKQSPEEIARIKDETIKSRSATKLYKNKELFSDSELRTVLNRLNTEKQIKQLSKEEIEAGRVWLRRADKLDKTINKVLDYYNTYQRVAKVLDGGSVGRNKDKKKK